MRASVMPEYVNSKVTLRCRRLSSSAISLLGYLVSGDDEHVVGVAALVECAEHLEQVWLDAGQERVGGLVEELDRRDVRSEGVVVQQLGDGFVVEQSRCGTLTSKLPQKWRTQ
jgi:hypothetical protein